MGLVYILELTEKNLFRIKGNIGWALSKCSAVSPLISAAFPHFRPDMTLLLIYSNSFCEVLVTRSTVHTTVTLTSDELSFQINSSDGRGSRRQTSPTDETQTVGFQHASATRIAARLLEEPSMVE